MTAPQSSRQALPVEIRLDSVTVALDGRAVLQDISFTLRGRRIGIVGRNGSGKSTLTRLLAGLIAPDSGAVRIEGLDLYADRRAALRTIGILFQNPDHQIIFPTVLEEIGFGLRQLGRSAKAAEAGARATLARFGREDWAEAHVHALSQGQRHLLCMMAVLAMDPKLVVLDEPYAGLDIPTRMQLARRLAGLPQALLHVSHDPRDIADSDHVLWLEQGRLAAEGPAAEILPAYEARMLALGEADDLADLAG